MKRRVGAVLVMNKRVISTGYNGTPRGLRNCNEGGCARCNSTSVSSMASANGTVTPIKSGVALDECLCLHAEENALLEAGRDRAEGGVMYCNT
jgi:dCMP deaminase